MNEPTPPAPVENRWATAWIDALAFAAGLWIAWRQGWKTGDLVWSLWLSSFVVGYAMIVWMIVRPGVDLVLAFSRGGQLPPGAIQFNGKDINAGFVPGATLLVVGGLFLLAFFTFHFGMFHVVHSVFLSLFFPVNGKSVANHGIDLALYLEVWRNYWMFLPVAFLAERQAFKLRDPETPADTAVTAEAIAARKKRNSAFGSGMSRPYKNVVRMHLLIFFFAGAHFLRLENFYMYAVVYAVYFFPWRVLKGGGAEG